MIQKLMLIFVAVLLLVATSASASKDGIKWQLKIQEGEKPALVPKPILVDVTDDAALYGRDKNVEAYESKTAIAPLESIVDVKMVHLFFGKKTVITTKWLAYNASINLVDLKNGAIVSEKPVFYPVFILWLLILFTSSISLAMHKINNTRDVVLNRIEDICSLISFILWAIFCLIVYDTFTGFGLALWLLPLAFLYKHPRTHKQILSSQQKGIAWYLVMLLALIIISQ